MTKRRCWLPSRPRLRPRPVTDARLAAAPALPARPFPVQIQLAPVSSPWFVNADLLIAADCTAYAYGNFHQDFVRGRVTLIGCPKLDPVNYAVKLSQIFRENPIRSVTVTRMTVPCCGGLSHAVKTAVAMSGRDILLSIVTIAPDGKVVG